MSSRKIITQASCSPLTLTLGRELPLRCGAKTQAVSSGSSQRAQDY